MIARHGTPVDNSDVNIPCPNPINCEGTDNPLANLSAEKPDRRHFFGYSFFPDLNVLCDVDTQELADICSAPIPQNPPQPIIYSSNAQSCTLDCGDGHSETYTVAAGTFVALDQAAADAQAYAFACLLAGILCSGGTIQIFTNTQQTCTVTCPNGGTYTYTIPAGLFTALTQVDANANAYLFACQLAVLLCAGLPPLPIPGQPRPVPDNALWGNSPQSCGYTCPDGSISTYTVRAGLFLRTSLAEANAAANSYACLQAVRFRICMGDIPSTSCAESQYAAAIEVTNLQQPATWSVISGALPPGLIFLNGFITGFPLVGGSYSFTVRVVGADGSRAEKQYTIRVLEITPDTLPDGTTSVAYSQVLSTVGQQGTIVWTVVDGVLPPGLTLDANTGMITGTPTLAGNYNFTIQASET